MLVTNKLGQLKQTGSGDSGYSGTSGFSSQSGASGFSSQSGVSGYSGFSGQSGYSGFTGQSGTSGTSGFTGISGYSGTDGNGQSGTSGYSGTSGTSGSSGYSGQSGTSGTSGTSGYTGQSGTSGTSGYSGVSGYSGYSGTDGNGLSGTSGFSGVSGYSGASGQSGYSGLSSQSGASGTSGTSGFSAAMADGSIITVTNSTSITVTTGSMTDITFDTTAVLVGNDFSHSTTSNTNRVVVNSSGNYLISWTASSDSGCWFEGQVLKNSGSALPGSLYNNPNSTSVTGDGAVSSYSFTAALTAGDYIGLQLQDSGGAGPHRASNASMSVIRVAAGQIGPSGFSGTSGTSGTSGYSGYSGVSGYSGQLQAFTINSIASVPQSPADRIVNNATPVVDSYLQITLLPNTGYTILGNLHFHLDSATTGLGPQWTFASAGTIADSSISTYMSTDAGELNYQTQFGIPHASFNFTPSLSCSLFLMQVSGFINTGSVGGILSVNWAQSSSSSNGLTLDRDSFIQVQSVGGAASGTSGFSGTFSGYSGFSGLSGFSGTSGTSGYTGTSGTSGATGGAGLSGTSGYTGQSGTSGTSGTSGYSGTSGPSGFSGIAGISTLDNGRLNICQYERQLGGAFSAWTISGSSGMFSGMFSGANNRGPLVSGCLVSGAHSPANALVINVLDYSAYVNGNFTNPTGWNIIQGWQTCTATSGTSMLSNMQNVAGIYPGMLVSAASGVSGNAVVVGISGANAIWISNNAFKTVASDGVMFGSPGATNGQAAAVSGQFCVDRWMGSNAAATDWMSQYQLEFVPNTGPLPDSDYYLQIAAYSGGTSLTPRTLEQRFEKVRTFANQQLTISFYAWLMPTTTPTGATTMNILPQWIQNFGTGGSPSAGVSGTIGTAALTTTPTLFSYTFTPSSISGKILGSTSGTDYLSIQFVLPAPNTTGLFYVNFSDFVLNYGPAAIAMPYLDPQVELARCQRYAFTLQNDQIGAQGYVPLQGPVNQLGLINTSMMLPVTMRIIPKFVVVTPPANWLIQQYSGGAATNHAPTFVVDGNVSTKQTASVNFSGTFITNVPFTVQTNSSGQEIVGIWSSEV